MLLQCIGLTLCFSFPFIWSFTLLFSSHLFSSFLSTIIYKILSLFPLSSYLPPCPLIILLPRPVSSSVELKVSVLRHASSIQLQSRERQRRLCFARVNLGVAWLCWSWWHNNTEVYECRSVSSIPQVWHKCLVNVRNIQFRLHINIFP
jgi:hypothetical protein